MKTLGVVRWEEFQLLLSQRVGRWELESRMGSVWKRWKMENQRGSYFSPGLWRFEILCAGSPKIELKEKRLLKNVHLSDGEDFGVIMFYRYVDFTWHSSSWCVLRGTGWRMDGTWWSNPEEVNVSRSTSLLTESHCCWPAAAAGYCPLVPSSSEAPCKKPI